MSDDKKKKHHEDGKEQEELAEDNVDEAEQEESTNELEALQERFEELENRYKRALADYQNLEKRVRDDKIQWIKAANKELIGRMLTVLDTLMLAAKHTNDEGIK